jgi:predicted outer membrane protein
MTTKGVAVSGARRLTGGMVALLLAACGSSSDRPEPLRPASLPKVPRPSVPAITAADYVAHASAIDLYVIKASELALQRSTTLKIREVATRLISAHQGSSAQLSLGGRRLNLLPTAELQPRHRALLEQLYASANFDRDYAQQMRAVHQDAVALHSGYVATGTSPTLVPIARALAPVMEQQRRLISYL